MKYFLTKLNTSIIALSFFAISLNANDIENLEVTIVDNSSVVKMEMNVASLNVIDVSLFNSFNRKIQNHKIGLGEANETMVDFSELRRGRYTLVSELGNMRWNKIFEVRNDQVELIDSYYSFIPEFKIENDLLTVHYLNYSNAEVAISLEDESNVYYDGYYDAEEDIFTKIYSLDNFKPGAYSVKFISNGEYFAHEFEVE